MSYSDREQSVRQGAPVELYAFHLGEKGWFYTSGDEEVEANSQTFLSVAIQRDDIEANEESGSFSMNVYIDKDLSLAEELVEHNPPTPIWVLMYRKHRTDPDVVVQFQGQVASMNVVGENVTLHCVSMQQALNKKIPRFRYQRMCNHVLYDQGCQVDPEEFKMIATVTAVDGAEVDVTWSGSHASWPSGIATGWATAGFLKVVSTGQRAFVVDHDTPTHMRLLVAVPGLLAGASLEIYAGCDRSPELCDSRFDNLSRFVGWPDIPEQNPFARAV